MVKALRPALPRNLLPRVALGGLDTPGSEGTRMVSGGAHGGPRSTPAYSDRVNLKYFTRVSRRGGTRQLWFLPGLVLKVGTSLQERRLLAEESRLTSWAARDPFWKGLAADALSIWGAGLVSRRYRSVSSDHFANVSKILDSRLADSATYPVRPMLDDVPRMAPVISAWSSDDSRRLADVLGDQTLPSTSMHGDLHFFNFVRSRRIYKVVDWETFEGDGSFVFDYVDFHVSMDQFNGARHWPTTLGSLSADHPAVRRAADVAGTTPRAIRAYYLAQKAAKILERRAKMGIDDAVERSGLLMAVRRATSGCAGSRL